MFSTSHEVYNFIGLMNKGSKRTGAGQRITTNPDDYFETLTREMKIFRHV